MLTITNTFELVDFGVMDALKPVMSALAPEATLADQIVVNVVLATWSTDPFVGVVAAMYRQEEPFQIANKSVSVS